ncbi:phosphotransferase [Thalassobaculum sp.]|uniref:phosphotransferase n=1 Tax=Thalassobaculum sp. TaxID=2022740 RepID=UPI0032EDF414
MLDQPSPSRATLASILGIAVGRLAETPLPGRVHDHWPLQPESGGPALMVRVPKLSHLGLSPRAALIYEAQAFRRAEPSGSTPRLHGLLRVGRRLPWGGLVVDAIDGRPPRLPDDLPALGRALAGVHGLPVPVPARRRPLLDPPDPVGYLLQVVRSQLDPIRDTLADSVRRLLDAEMAAAAATVGADRPAPRLTLADTHPGNFRIRADGTAVMLDVERPVYDSPAVDLAHASLPTSLTWDPAVTGGAGRPDIVGFHRAWATAVPRPVAATVRPHVLAYRRLIWLRTTTWACAWAARTDVAAALASSRPEVADQARRLARFVDPAMMEAARQQWTGPRAFTAEELVP